MLYSYEEEILNYYFGGDMKRNVLGIMLILFLSSCSSLHLHLNDPPGGEGTLAVPVEFTNDAEGEFVYNYSLVGEGTSSISIPLEPTTEEFLYITVPAGKYVVDKLSVQASRQSDWNLSSEDKIISLDPGYKVNVYRDEVTLFQARVKIERKAVGYGETFVSSWDITSLNKAQQNECKEKVRATGKSPDGFIH